MENSNKVDSKDETNDIMNQFLKFIFSESLGYIVCLSNYMYRECIKYAKKINSSEHNIYNINNKKQFNKLLTCIVNDYNEFKFLHDVTFVIELSFQHLDINRYMQVYREKMLDSLKVSDEYERQRIDLTLFSFIKTCLGYDDNNGPTFSKRNTNAFVSGSDYSNYQISDYQLFPNGLKKNNINKDDINNSIHFFKTVTKNNDICLPNDLLSNSSRLIRKTTYNTIYNLFVTEYKMMYKYYRDEVPRYKLDKSLTYLRLKDIFELIIKDLNVVPDEYVYSQILYSMLAMENANILELYDSGQAFGYDDDIYCYIKPTAASLFATKYGVGVASITQQVGCYILSCRISTQKLPELLKECFDKMKIDYDDNLINDVIIDGYRDKDGISLSWIDKIHPIDMLSFDLAILQTLTDYNLMDKDENLEQTINNELWKNACTMLGLSSCMDELLDNSAKPKRKNKKL